MSLKVFAFSITGKKHRDEGATCQDAVTSWVDRNKNRGCVVLADGAGSAKFAKTGALVTCNYTKSLFKKNQLDENFLVLLRQRLGMHAKRMNANVKEFASTLLFAGVEGETYKIIHVGDGLIACMHDDGVIRPLSCGFKGEYANETVFTTTDGVEKFVFYRTGNLTEERIKAFFLMSDGMQHVFYERSSNTFGRALYKIYDWFREEEEMQEMKKQIKSQRDVFYQKTYDDLSLCILGVAK